MKILQVIPFFTPKRGGSVESAYKFSIELANRGHDITLITTDFELDEKFINFVEKKDIKIIPFKCKKNWGLFLYSPKMKKWVKKNIRNFDVINFHNFRSYQNNITSIYAKKYNIPYVLHAHGSLPRIMNMQNLKLIYDIIFGYRLLKGASKVVATSSIEMQQYIKMGLSIKDIVLIPNGINLMEYNQLPCEGYFRKKFCLDINEKLILYIGRIHKIKGIDVLIKAFYITSTKMKNIKLAIVGPNDGYLNEIRRLINSLHLEDKVIITGPLYGIEKHQAYVDTDIVVLPSRYEIFGIVILESYACSKPVIATKVSGLGEMVLNGKTGLLVTPCNIDELSSAILNMMYDESGRNKMGVEARKFVEENFSIKNATDKLEDLYSSIINARAYKI